MVALDYNENKITCNVKSSSQYYRLIQTELKALPCSLNANRCTYVLLILKNGLHSMLSRTLPITPHSYLSVIHFRSSSHGLRHTFGIVIRRNYTLRDNFFVRQLNYYCAHFFLFRIIYQTNTCDIKPVLY